jgi:hypothetical protein
MSLEKEKVLPPWSRPSVLLQAVDVLCKIPLKTLWRALDTTLGLNLYGTTFTKQGKAKYACIPS